MQIKCELAQLTVIYIIWRVQSEIFTIFLLTGGYLRRMQVADVCVFF